MILNYQLDKSHLCKTLRLGHISSTQTLPKNTLHNSFGTSNANPLTKKMSVASPIQCIRILNPSSSSSSSSSSSTASSSFRFSTTKPCVFIIRCSQAEGPLRRPSAPPTLREPSPPQKPVAPPSPSSSSPPPPQPQKSVAADGKSVITVEFQRQKAKELQDYFKQKKLEAAGQGPFFGFQPKNEISNGRYLLLYF